MYAATQSAIDPALAALMQTAQMVTPDNTPTVAAQVAEAAKQKLAPRGITQGMPQARQDFQAAMPSVMRNMQQQQVEQMVKQVMQPKPAGIEGLPAPNMSNMAEGGVVGFSGEGEFGSSVPDPVAMAMDELRVAEIKRKRKEAEDRQRLEFLEQAGAPQAAALRQQMAPPPSPERMRDTRNVPMPSPGASQATQPAPSKSQVRPQAPAPVAPSTGVAQLVEPQFRGEGIPQAGKEFLTDAEQRIARMQAIEDQRAAAKAAMPDLNAQGIAALQKAEEERKRLLGIEQSDDARRRWAGVFRGWGGDRDAYDRIVGGINQRDALANQAQLGFEQAKIKLQQAQQAEALGQFDRKLAFEKEAAELTNKARDDMLKARQIESVLAANLYSTEANIYGTKSSARERGLDREQQAKFETEKLKLEGAKLQQMAVQNNQMQLANRINAANITVNNSIDKMEKALANKYGPMMNVINMMTPEMLQKEPKLAATYDAYIRDKEAIYKQTVEPAVMERNRLAAQVGGGVDKRYDAQGNLIK